MRHHLLQLIHCTKLSIVDFVFRIYLYENVTYFDDATDDNHLFFDDFDSHALIDQGVFKMFLFFFSPFSHFIHTYQNVSVRNSQLINRCHFVI